MSEPARRCCARALPPTTGATWRRYWPSSIRTSRCSRRPSWTFRGHEGYRAWVEAWLDAWEEFRIEPIEIEQFGDGFLVLMDIKGRGKGSGAEVSLQFWWLYTVPVDRATRVHLYPTREAALETIRA
jgi:hypothetical protein